MKYLFTLMVVLGLSYKCSATGPLVVNSPQSGVVNYVATNSVVTAFSPAFTATPEMSFFVSVTNLTPLTATVTSSNFTLVIAATNASAGGGWGSVAWSAFVGTPRVQYGTVSTPPASGTTTNIVVFPAPFYSNPSVVISGSVLASATNAIPVVSSVTNTSFTISYGGNTNQTVYWNATGVSTLPVTGSAPANGLNPVGN